jgi:hypothetical protein
VTAFPQTSSTTVEFTLQGKTVAEVERRAADHLAQVAGPEYDARQWQLHLKITPADDDAPRVSSWEQGVPPPPTWWEGYAVASRSRR